jgi:DNA-binding NtrC family response regulator
VQVNTAGAFTVSHSSWEWFAKKLAYSARFETTLAKLEQERFTVAEAAEIAGVHVKTLRKHIKQDKLTVSQPSARKTWVHKRDLAAYLCRGGT